MLHLPSAVGPRCILTMRVVPVGVTFYRRPTVQQYREHPATINCVVPACGREWRIGTQFCRECGEPVSWRAIASITQQLPTKIDRAIEVRRRYGLAMPQYASLTDQPSATLRQLPRPSTGPRAASTPDAATRHRAAPPPPAAAIAPTPGLGSAAKAAAPKAHSCSRAYDGCPRD